jgi:PAS domain S-box-containing protein
MKPDQLFQDFQSSFLQATPDEKDRFLAQLLIWEEQHKDLIPPSANSTLMGGIEPLSANKLKLSSTTKDQRGIVQVFRDLIEKEAHVRQVAENIEQVFWLRGVNSGRILYVSPAFEAIWGRSIKSLYADSSILIESVHPEDRVQVMAANTHYNHKPLNQAYRILRPDGSLRWIHDRTFIIHGDSGDSSYLFCIAQDITSQKQVDLALRRTLDRSREQFDLSRKMSLARKADAVLRTVMSAHELRSALRSALLFFDDPKAGPARGMELTASWLSSQSLRPWLSESSLYEEPAFWELLQPSRTVVINGIKTDARVSQLLRDFLLEGRIHTLVLFPLVASGVWLGCLAVYFEEETRFNHIELRHLKVLIDQATITLYNLKLLEVAEDSRHEAEQANEIKTQFLAMISHELRTPLTSIIGFTTTLLADDVTWEPDEQHDFIQTIQQEANRLEELIEHLLDLSRLEAGMLPILLKPHSLHEIMQDASPQLQMLTSGHILTVHVPDGLPPVLVDEKRIAQVLVNLVRNASSYAPKGTEVTISANVRGRFVQINVNDQGPGIPLSEHKKVFKAFLRGENAEAGTTKGAGLGLAICKGLVEAHGGRIWIKKKNTPGTTVSFSILLVPPIPLDNPKEEER